MVPNRNEPRKRTATEAELNAPSAAPSAATESVKKGRPKGRKDDPRPADAPRRGRPPSATSAIIHPKPSVAKEPHRPPLLSISFETERAQGVQGSLTGVTGRVIEPSNVLQQHQLAASKGAAIARHKAIASASLSIEAARRLAPLPKDIERAEAKRRETGAAIQAGKQQSAARKRAEGSVSGSHPSLNPRNLS